MTVAARQGHDDLRVRRLNIDEYHQLIESGIFSSDERVELIEGVLHQMTPKGPRHTESLRRLLRLLTIALGTARLGSEVEISVQDPISIPETDSEPEPDLALLAPREGGYSDRHPHPDEVLLVVEVADTSLNEDHAVKVPLYAAAGIEEYWLVNLADDELEVFREPKLRQSGQAAYHQRLLYDAGDTVTPLRFPDCTIDVAPLFP